MTERVICASHIVVNCRRQDDARYAPTGKQRGNVLNRAVATEEQQIVDAAPPHDLTQSIAGLSPLERWPSARWKN